MYTVPARSGTDLYHGKKTLVIFVLQKLVR